MASRKTHSVHVLVTKDAPLAPSEADKDFIVRAVNAHDDMLAALYSAEIKLARYMSIHGPNSAEPLRATYSGGLSAEYEASLKTIRAAIAKAEPSEKSHEDAI